MVRDNVVASMGAEDFSYMLEKVPGAMVWLGNGGGDDAVGLHNSRYDFNDMAIPFGVSFFVRTVERYLAEQPEA
jgi:metal-dependent amidase/aminoacylase/carboxypeptidase family protein